MKLIWSLAKRKYTNDEYHSEFIYDMYYLSIAMAKDLGYKTVLYGTSDAIEKLKSIVDEVINVDDIDFKLYDDIKIHIWASRNDEYITLDGDVFLYKRINLLENSYGKKIEIAYEKKDIIPHNTIKNALDVFNSYGPKSVIPEWNTENLISFNTGIIHWNNNSEFKKYYIESFLKLKEWYFPLKDEMESKNYLLTIEGGLPSHFICEHLMKNLATHYNIGTDEIGSNLQNKYDHWKGPSKFKDLNKINSLKILVDTHKFRKQRFGTNPIRIEMVYNDLLNENIITPFIYLKRRFE